MTDLAPTTPSDDPITDDDLRRSAESLNETEDLWAKIASMADPVITCPDCGGTGTLAGGGSLGEIPCDRCEGQRTVEHPAAEYLGRMALPDFKPARKKLLAMGQQYDARKRAEYEIGIGKEGVVLGPVPTRNEMAELEKEIAALKEQGRATAVKQLAEPGVGTRNRREALPASRPKNTAGSLGGGHLNDPGVDLDDEV